MQIFGNDYYKRKAICSGKGATSVLFKIDDTASGNEFFDFIDAVKAGGDV